MFNVDKQIVCLLPRERANFDLTVANRQIITSDKNVFLIYMYRFIMLIKLVTTFIGSFSYFFVHVVVYFNLLYCSCLTLINKLSVCCPENELLFMCH